MTYIVTGAAGFIGANLVQALNAKGIKDVIAVDELQPADKYRNLADLDIVDYLDKSDSEQKDFVIEMLKDISVSLNLEIDLGPELSNFK